MVTIKILGVEVTDATKEEALEFIVKGLEKHGKKLSIFTPNPEIIMHSTRDERFKQILNSADLALADGVGVKLAGRLLGKPLKERITGVDFMLALCERAAKEGFTVGLMGGGPKIAERTAECLLQKYPKLKIVYVAEEWRKDGFVRAGEVRSMKYEVREEKIQNSIDILFVALGYPKQEEWIYENLPKIPVKVAMVVGGSFDYISGAISRAPLFVRNAGLEWLFRLLRQPWRIRRQLALAKFFFLVLKERFFPQNKIDTFE